MRALILAGGKGTRLRPLTVYTPKPVVPVVNRPFLTYQLEILQKAAITDIVLSLNYQPNKIEDLLGDGREFGVRLSYVTEPMPMGTGGAYRYAAEDIRETTVVFNGDILTDIDIAGVIERHRSTGAKATIVLTPVADPSAYGLVESGDNGRVLRFLEKPSSEMLSSISVDTINAGIYVLEPEILDLIPKGENTSFEYNVFPTILEKEMPFFAYVMKDNYWRDLGTPQSYLAANSDLLGGKVKGFEMPAKAAADIATAAVIDSRSVIGEGCVIKPNARIINSVLGPGVHVEEKAVIEDSVVWSHTRIAAAAEFRGSFVGRSSHIGRNAAVTAGTVLGDKTTLPDYSRT